jgi:hypothetical protein
MPAHDRVTASIKPSTHKPTSRFLLSTIGLLGLTLFYLGRLGSLHFAGHYLYLLPPSHVSLRFLPSFILPTEDILQTKLRVANV